MSCKTIIIPYVFAALAGICFIQGVAVLTRQGGTVKHGQHKKTGFNA